MHSGPYQHTQATPTCCSCRPCCYHLSPTVTPAAVSCSWGDSSCSPACMICPATRPALPHRPSCPSLLQVPTNIRRSAPPMVSLSQRCTYFASGLSAQLSRAGMDLLSPLAARLTLRPNLAGVWNIEFEGVPNWALQRRGDALQNVAGRAGGRARQGKAAHQQGQQRQLQATTRKVGKRMRCVYGPPTMEHIWSTQKQAGLQPYRPQPIRTPGP